MFECGLTRGGFYAHFKSKAHLYEEALRDGHLARLASMPVDPSNDWLRHVFAACSGDAPISSDWTFLATDASSAKPEIRESYLRAVDTMTRKLAEHLQPRAPDSSDDVPLAAAAMLIGAMAIASSVDSPRAKTAFVTPVAIRCNDSVTKAISRFSGLSNTLSRESPVRAATTVCS